ncbi:MAG: aconitase X catalytic domain-containing protein [Candidatus Diapherotrites archaeon]|nr:aconitase X catalytic domain-containing protein [Candidatus Diapherotrites archaeon]
MDLTNYEKEMLEGKHGIAVKKAMYILVALGNIFGAKKMVEVSSVQIAGVSYDNLGEAGLDYLSSIAEEGGKARVLTTLNPAGMDLENWKNLGISKEFAEKQKRVIEAFQKMGVITTCTCTPYFIGNNPHYGEHVAWSESSAVAYGNSVLGLKTNREGGPSALASALTGRTPLYGLHLDENRNAKITIKVNAEMNEITDFGALGYAIGKKIGKEIPLIKGIEKAGVEELKSFSASIATYGGQGLYHIEEITPNKTNEPKEVKEISQQEIDEAKKFLNDDSEVDLISVGCPHCSLKEIQELAELLKGKKVKKEFWICVARPIKSIADSMGYTKIIEESGAKFACDTCMAVAPLKGRFKCLATNSAKAIFYGRGKNQFKTIFKPLNELIELAVRE